jgi:hypothetical protein
VLWECCRLIKHGVASDLAFSLSNNARGAMLIIFGELDGNEFDWKSGKWKKK